MEGPNETEQLHSIAEDIEICQWKNHWPTPRTAVSEYDIFYRTVLSANAPNTMGRANDQT